MGRYALPNDFQNVTIVKNLDPSYANAVAVNFQLENNNDGTYRLTVDTDAQDLILYPFPPEVGSGSFVTEHEIGRDPGDYVPYTKINGTRENKTDKIIPNFHVEQFVNGIDNVYFDDRGLLSRDCPVSFTYSLHTDDDYSCYEGTLDVKENILDLISGLETAGEPVVNKVNVKEWEITGYDVNGLNIDDVIGERRTDGDLFDNNYIISFSQNPGDIVTNVAFDPSWTIVEDQIVNASNLYGSRKYLDADTLNRTGGLPEEYISTYYPAVSPSDYTKNMYFIASNLVKSDNPAVVIHPQTEGSYNVRVLGSDGRDYRGLDIGTIVYSGKGLKTNDLFIINKTESIPKKLVAIYGEAEDDYALSFLDRNGNWKEIPVYGSGGDILTWWDVTGLNGLYTVRLISRMGQKMNADFIDVYIGNVVNAKDVGVILTSAGGQSKLIFPEGSVTSDTLVTVDEMPFDKVRDIAVLPDIDPVGRVVKFGPAGMSFTHLPDDVLPQVQFTYHRSELEDVYNPLELRIWFLNDEGKLEELPTIKAVYDENDNPLWSDDPAYGPGGNFDDVKDNYACLRRCHAFLLLPRTRRDEIGSAGDRPE